MPCLIIKESDGTTTFMCGEHLRREDLALCSQPDCNRWAEFLCDYPVGEGKTCDLMLCEHCAKKAGPNYHFCPVHFAEFSKRGIAKVEEE